MGRRAERELTTLLGTDVKIGGVEYSPFTRIILTDVSISNPDGSSPLHIGHLGAGVSVTESLWNSHPVITYAEIIDLDAHLWRDSVNAPLNIAPIIERFKKKETGGKSVFDLAINLLVIRRSTFTYDILNQPPREDGCFDPAHISIGGIRADIRAPRISNDNISIDIKRLGASDKSGLTLSSLTAFLHIDSAKCMIQNLGVQMPHSLLSFDNIEVDGSPLTQGFNPKKISTKIATLPGSHLSSEDIAPVVPTLRGLNITSDIELEMEGGMSLIDIPRLAINVRDKDCWINLSGKIYNLDHAKDSLAINLERISANFNAPGSLSMLASRGDRERALAKKLKPLASLGDINLLGQMAANTSSLDFNGSIITTAGSIDIDAGVARPTKSAPIKIDGTIKAAAFNPSGLETRLKQLTNVSLEASADLSVSRSGAINGIAEMQIDNAIWSGVSYSDITAQANFSGYQIDASIDSHSPSADLSLRGGYEMRGNNPLTELYADIRHLSLSPLFAESSYGGCDISAEIDASVHGHKADNLNGWININNLHFAPTDKSKPTLQFDHISINSVAEDSVHTLTFKGGPVDLTLKGEYSYPGLIADMKRLCAKAFPSLMPDVTPDGDLTSIANLDITINPDSVISRFFRLPVEVIYPVQLSAKTDAYDNKASLILNAPYLKQKDKLIENTTLTAGIDGGDCTSFLGFNTTVPTKNGPMDLNINSSGITDSLLTAISWRIDRATDFHGDLCFSTAFSRDDDGLQTDIRFTPTDLVFNDSAWHVTPAEINIHPHRILVSNFGATRPGQSLAINGEAAADSLSRMVVSLDHIDLDYVFETLAISDAVNFGGRATGKIYAEALLSKDPVLYTPRLMVKGLSYNHCTFGDGDIHSWWDNNTKTITIGADIAEPNGKHSTIAGTIKPITEELDFNFSADEAPAGFMLPFMSAFTSSVNGLISGNARLYGTFKDLDLEGDIFVRDLSMKLDFTNTVYTVSDSVHIAPGEITFNDVTLNDRYGNSAKLSGRVTHEYFHEPKFTFNITNASNMLVYDIGEHDTQDPWYGRIYGIGSATVTGVPGKIDIAVNMRTAPKSTFTFVLSDAEQSVEYDFITLRDRDRDRKDSIAALDPTPLIVRQLRDRINRQEQGSPSVYAMEFNVDITPEATINLIMDPIGGDKITANGTGHLRMNYASDGELEMFGEYTLNRGTYNFTLQDIIIKDFTILEGSKITFLGDPYAAQLNIRAAYTLNANLSDLDESFLEDRELTRTNVKVNAIMIVTGDMRQPDIKFDLEFPTLTADTYRKVRSIISTDEMMSRQIIYLLALNRFYTPEYMATTHGNELVSVASSTLSSRLGSMLGQLSDNWSIAPAIRSDRGDFSDVEVDVALSSQLLDNRLLFNGNLGYRDKSLNNNSFIGDFDIRYLLNRAGTIQLKAYNRYNDQNYYLKSALTTQGVGVVFKRDFDNIFSFLRPLRKKKKAKNYDKASETDYDADPKSEEPPVVPDSIPATNDSIPPAPTSNRFEVKP